jgi:hypothetical protein
MAKGKTTAAAKKAPGMTALEKAVEKATQGVRAARQALEGQDLESLTPDGRLHSAGKLREGEDLAMIGVLDTIDKFPGLFAALAPHDHGEDDQAVETGPSRAALARRALLAPLAKELADLLARVSDDMLACGEKAKDVTVPAYAIIKASAASSPALRASAAKAIGFYAAQAKRKKPAKKADATNG